MKDKKPLPLCHQTVFCDGPSYDFLLYKVLYFCFLLGVFLMPHTVVAGKKLPKSKNNTSATSVENLYFAEQHNPATKALLPQHLIELSVDNSYFLKELMDKSIYAQLSYRENRFVLAVSHSGYAKYGELKLTTGYSKVWGRRFSLNTNFHYWLNHIEKRSPVHSFSFDVSFQTIINNKIGFGVEVDNPAHLKYGVVGRYPLPLCITAHLYYKIGVHTLIASQVEKRINGHFNMGLLFLQQVNALHFTIAPSLLDTEIGVGIRFRHLLLTYHAGYNYKLGMTMRLNLNIDLKKNTY